MDATADERSGPRIGERPDAAGYEGRAGVMPAPAEFGDRVARGTVAGIAAGLVFLVANMLWATKSDLPAVAPLVDISTIFNFDDVAHPTTENMFIGLVTHLTLSATFGVGLYIVNFQILGRTAFPWFQEGPDQVFEVFAHAGFGLLLLPFFVSRRFT